MENTYELKTTDVTAVQWDGTNKDALFKFANAQTVGIHNGTDIVITTKMNAFTLVLGDYLVKDVNGNILYFRQKAFEYQYQLKK